MPDVTKFSVFIAVSLDGYIAKPDGNIDWLHQGFDEIPGEDFGFNVFMDSIDVMVMGRVTMEKVLQFEQWPYEGKRVIVLSNTLQAVPDRLSDRVELFSGSIADLATQLTSQGYTRVYVDGGKTIQSFINNTLITDLTITTIPILLGEGKRLFGKTTKDIYLQHQSTKAYSNGFVTSSYIIKRE